MRYAIPLLKNSEEEFRKDLRDKHFHFTDLQILLMNPEAGPVPKNNFRRMV